MPASPALVAAVTPRRFLDVACARPAMPGGAAGPFIPDAYGRAELAELGACAFEALPVQVPPVQAPQDRSARPGAECPAPHAAWSAARQAVACAALRRASEARACAEQLAIALHRTATMEDAAETGAHPVDAHPVDAHPVDRRETAERQAVALWLALRRVDLALAAGLAALDVQDVPGAPEEA